MNLSAPSMVIFIVSAILAILGVVVALGSVAIGVPAVWIMCAAYVVLAIGCLLTGI